MDSVMAFLAQYFYLLVVAGAAGWILLRRRDRLVEAGLAAVVIGGVAFVLAQAATRVIADPRPFLVSGVASLIPSSTDNGFPSDHTLLVAMVAAVVTVFDLPAGAVFWVLAAVVGLARVYARVHHVLDVAGSLVLVAIGLAVYLALAAAWRARRRTGPAPSEKGPRTP